MARDAWGWAAWFQGRRKRREKRAAGIFCPPRAAIAFSGLCLWVLKNNGVASQTWRTVIESVAQFCRWRFRRVISGCALAALVLAAWAWHMQTREGIVDFQAQRADLLARLAERRAQAVAGAEEARKHADDLQEEARAQEQNAADAARGTQLQLVLYMNALLKNADAVFGDGSVKIEAKPGGMFYFHIDDPVLSSNTPLDPAEREQKLLKCFKMSGLALNEKDAVNGIDEGASERGSDIIPVKINKDGSFGKASSVEDADYFERLGEAVIDKAKEIGDMMTDGFIEPKPYTKGNASACDYCLFHSICGYEAQ
jgi:hypothetical protein